MTGPQFKKLRLSVGLATQQAAADFLHRGLRAVHGWENGKAIDPLAIKLLRLMVKMKLTHEDVT